MAAYAALGAYARANRTKHAALGRYARGESDKKMRAATGVEARFAGCVCGARG